MTLSLATTSTGRTRPLQNASRSDALVRDGTVLVDDEGFAVDDRDVQLARITAMNGSLDPV